MGKEPFGNLENQRKTFSYNLGNSRDGSHILTWKSKGLGHLESLKSGGGGGHLGTFQLKSCKCKGWGSFRNLKKHWVGPFQTLYNPVEKGKFGKISVKIL